MGLFGKRKKLEEEIRIQNRRIDQLKNLCEEKDSVFKELMSDALRNGSSLGGKHMADRKKYLRGK